MSSSKKKNEDISPDFGSRIKFKVEDMIKNPGGNRDADVEKMFREMAESCNGEYAGKAVYAICNLLANIIVTTDNGSAALGRTVFMLTSLCSMIERQIITEDGDEHEKEGKSTWN